MEENNNLLMCCVKDLFGGCGPNIYTPALRFMFASVLQKDADGCFSLKTSPVISTFDVTRCGGIVETEQSTGVVIEGTTQPIPVCIEGGQPIELGGFEACYDGRPAHIEIIRDETTGAIDRYVAHYKDGSGTVVDPADLTMVSNCPVTETREVCDIVTASITGGITYTITGAEVALSDLTTLTFTNDTARYFWTDFGNGFSDVGPLPSAIYNDGHYEIKTYAVMRSGNKLLIATKEIDVVGGVITVTGANPQPVANNYPISVGTAMQEYSGSTPVGSPTNPDGSAYTVQGTLAWNCPAIIDDLEDNAEYQAAVASPVVTNPITPERFIGDNGYFTGYLTTDAASNAVSWVVLDGNAPSSLNAVATSEYGYSFTATTTPGETLDQFIINNGGSSYNPGKVLSITIFNDDDTNDLVFDGLRGLSKTVLKAGRARSMTWGDGQSYAIRDKFFGEFTFQSTTEVTINWEQGDV